MTKAIKFFEILGQKIPENSSTCVEMNVPNLYSHSPATIPIYIKTGKLNGPILLVTAAIHGDELNGVEIVRKLVRSIKSQPKRGALIAIPVVNLQGFATLSRYLPDRRDLNRCFPGKPKGSLASRIADLITKNILKNVTHLIDLHTAAKHRTNLPQIRTDTKKSESLKIAKAFGAPIILHAAIRDGSLRETANRLGISTIVFEGGEALKFDEAAVRCGYNGILHVMKKLKMVTTQLNLKKTTPQIAVTSSWVRTTVSGMCYFKKKLGSRILEGEELGKIIDPLSLKEEKIYSSKSGVIIGCTTTPLVNEGDGIANIALFNESDEVQEVYHNVLY